MYEVTKGCHTCIWNDVSSLKTCERLQKESTFLHCPNWQKNELKGKEKMTKEQIKKYALKTHKTHDSTYNQGRKDCIDGNIITKDACYFIEVENIGMDSGDRKGTIRHEYSYRTI